MISLQLLTDNNDETGTTDKFLLLVDQLSLEQPQHLSIKDIGIILDRLSSKIIDVAILERQIEATDTHNWTIKATIRGEVMRELGVIYNSNYYAISEHPDLNFSKRLVVSADGRGKLQSLKEWCIPPDFLIHVLVCTPQSTKSMKTNNIPLKRLGSITTI